MQKPTGANGGRAEQEESGFNLTTKVSLAPARPDAQLESNSVWPTRTWTQRFCEQAQRDYPDCYHNRARRLALAHLVRAYRNLTTTRRAA